MREMAEQDQIRSAREVEAWLVDWIANRYGFERETIDADSPLASLGLDSVAALELTADLEDRFDVTVPDTAAWSHPTIQLLAGLVTGEEFANKAPQKPPASDRTELETLLDTLGE